MKKLILLILPVLFIMAACNNKASTESAAAGAAKDTVAVNTTKTDSTTDGTPTTPAQVFDENTLKVMPGAKITATDADRKAVDSTTSDDKGNYAFTKLTAGKTYTYTTAKTGYTTTSQTKLYDGVNSLPAFPLK